MTRSAYSWLSGDGPAPGIALCSKADRLITLEGLPQPAWELTHCQARARYPTRLSWGELPIWISGPTGVAY